VPRSIETVPSRINGNTIRGNYTDAGGVTHGFIAVDTKPIFGDFGPSGIWRWDESKWTKILTLDTQNLVTP